MRILILILLSIVFAQSVNAKSWLIISKQTKEILSLSNEDDAQLPDSTYEKIIIDDNYWDINLSEHPTMYLYKNSRFIKNIEKISNIEIEKEKAIEAGVRGKLIAERMYKIAETELIAEGIINE